MVLGRLRTRLLASAIAGTMIASAAGWVAWSIPEASACGGFFSRRAAARRTPSLAHEQVLIIYDAKAETEHFIRQVAFRDGGQRFGFVVPTPARPEIAKVETPPFEALRRRFPFDPPPLDLAIGTGAGFGGAGSPRGSVRVLDTKKVGSFTAFTLQADDGKALSQWLADNEFESTPEADAWLDHYVRMKFFFVAMRHDPEPTTARRGEDAPIRAETVRISFSSALPYYPYFEPDRSKGVEATERLLELWLVSTESFVPVAASANAEGTTWVRPMKPGKTYAHDPLKSIDGAGLELAPKQQLVVQTFQDQKSSRAGFGDVLFVPEKKGTLTEARKRRLAELAAIVDPTLVPGVAR